MVDWTRPLYCDYTIRTINKVGEGFYRVFIDELQRYRTFDKSGVTIDGEPRIIIHNDPSPGGRWFRWDGDKPKPTKPRVSNPMVEEMFGKKDD